MGDDVVHPVLRPVAAGRSRRRRGDGDGFSADGEAGDAADGPDVAGGADHGSVMDDASDPGTGDPDAEVADDTDPGDADTGPWLNPCGGDGTLPFEPGDPCGTFGGGVFVCNGPDLVRCVGPDDENLCGSCGPLAAAPGDPCGACGEVWRCRAGRWACAGVDAVVCAGADAGSNGCRGCAPLEAVPGAPGGECAGSAWTCSE